MANLVPKRMNHLSQGVDLANRLADLIGEIRVYRANAVSQGFDGATGVADSDCTGDLDHLDRSTYRQGLTAFGNLLTYWDDADNTRGKPDQKILALTRE